MTEATKNYVVLSWKPPGEKGLEGVMYYVEKVKLNLSNNIFLHVTVFLRRDGDLVSLFVSVSWAQTAGRG